MLHKNFGLLFKQSMTPSRVCAQIYSLLVSSSTDADIGGDIYLWDTQVYSLTPPYFHLPTFT